MSKHQTKVCPFAIILQKNSGIVTLSCLRRDAAGQRGCTLLQQELGGFPVQSFLLEGEETAVLPKNEFTVLTSAEIPFAALYDGPAAPGAVANDSIGRGKQEFRTGHRVVILDKIHKHLLNRA